VKVHALVLVLVDGAPQLVGALLEGHREGSRLAGLNGGRGLLVDARPFDREIVRSLTGVVHGEGVWARREGLRGQADRVFLLSRRDCRTSHGGGRASRTGGGACRTGGRRCRPGTSPATA